MKTIITKHSNRHIYRTVLFLVASLFATQLSFAAGKKDLLIESQTPTSQDELTTDVSPQEEEAFSKIAYSHELPQESSVSFHEVWAYVLDGRTKDLAPEMNITDLCLFSAGINSYGEINYVPDIKQLDSYTARKHLVITCDSKSLTHFVLSPEYSVREKLVSRLAKIAKPYDGLQIDFELVPARDDKNFTSFLLEVRRRIGREKWFSVALPARTKTLSEDVYNYEEISSCVDRIVVMAYDEHWAGSKPGPVASMEWCENVANYASSTIPSKKLIMGLPFYGRTWVEENYATAWRFQGINDMLNEENFHTVTRDEKGIPTFQFQTQVTVTGYFDDTYSLVKRCKMYEEKGVQKVAFWRVGQEDDSFWQYLKLN